MARFSFSINSRKKQTLPPPPNGQPMSKAQKILGTVPLNIDAPGGWDDTAGSVISDDRSAITATSHFDPELQRYEHDPQVVVSNPGENWGEESDIIPNSLRMNSGGLGDQTGRSRTDIASTLRKSRSSSTIRSWYDKSKLPLSISQQTSSSAIAKGLPTRVQQSLNPRDMDQTLGSKRKPAMLDLAFATRKGSDATSKGMLTGSSFDRMLRSPSSLSPFSPGSTRSRGSRKFRSTPTEDNVRSPVSGTPRSGAGSSSLLSPGTPHELPSLYEHYEQMSFHHIMRQSSTPSLRMTENGILTLDNVAEALYEDQDEVAIDPRCLVPQTPNMTGFIKSDLQSSPGDGARSVSSRHTKTSKTSKSTDRSLEAADLLQTSVLMLSSDSEDDDVEGQPTAQFLTAAPMRRPSYTEDRVPPLEECRPKKSRVSRPGEKRRSQPSKQVKRASFATPNTYTVIPNPVNGHVMAGPVDSRSGTPLGSSSQRISSSRSSVMSDFSINSAITWQERPDYGIQEARAITMLPARRPLDTRIQEEDESLVTSDLASEEPFHLSSSTDQLTPPLSPSSVDFYVRSAHSSVDGPGSQGRLMAVTRQEQMLLSALRQKQQAMGRTSMTQVSEESEVESNRSIKQRVKNVRAQQSTTESEVSSNDSESLFEEKPKMGHRQKSSQATIRGSMFDFGFPAPPSFKESASKEPGLAQSKPRSAAPAQIETRILTHGKDSIPTRPAGPPPTLALPELPKSINSAKSPSSRGSASTPSPCNASLSFEDAEPSPNFADMLDWEPPLASPLADKLTLDDLLDTPWSETESGSGERGAMSPSNSDTLSFMGSNTFTGYTMQGFDEDEEEIGEVKDIPRPDSPISPTSFPTVPEKRTTRVNMARLSAVGPGLLSNAGELGWWGDDD